MKSPFEAVCVCACNCPDLGEGGVAGGDQHGVHLQGVHMLLSPFQEVLCSAILTAPTWVKGARPVATSTASTSRVSTCSLVLKSVSSTVTGSTPGMPAPVRLAYPQQQTYQAGCQTRGQLRGVLDSEENLVLDSEMRQLPRHWLHARNACDNAKSVSATASLPICFKQTRVRGQPRGDIGLEVCQRHHYPIHARDACTNATNLFSKACLPTRPPDQSAWSIFKDSEPANAELRAAPITFQMGFNPAHLG